MPQPVEAMSSPIFEVQVRDNLSADWRTLETPESQQEMLRTASDVVNSINWNWGLSIVEAEQLVRVRVRGQVKPCFR